MYSANSWLMCWDFTSGVYSCPVAIITFVPPDTAQCQLHSCADLNSSRHPSHTAETLRDSQPIPNGDSLWKEATRRQPSGFPVRLSSRIKQSNRQHETCSAASSSAHCSLFGKELTGYNDCSGCLSLQTCLKWHSAVCRLSPTHLATPAEVGMYIFRSRWSVLQPCSLLAHHFIHKQAHFSIVIIVGIFSINSVTEWTYIQLTATNCDAEMTFMVCTMLL